MTEPTTNPILEKMARAIADVDGEHGDYSWASRNEYGRRVAVEQAQAALRSLLPLDQRAHIVANDAADEATGEHYDFATPQMIEAALTAFINHALGGK